MNPRRTRKEVERASPRETVERRDGVLAIVAHDLRSPISTILTAAELLRQHCGRDNDAQKFVEMITCSARQADMLIRDLVDVTRIESGRFRIDPERKLLAAILTEVTGFFVDNAAKAGVMLGCDCREAKELVVQVDYSRFAQLLSNLLDNAIKFTAPGGSIRVSAVPDGLMARVSVRDTGIGISTEDVPHVFERFWQATRHQRAGAGLGLAIAKGIAEAHGGTIGVRSTEGLGSTFEFTLPLDRPCREDEVFNRGLSVLEVP